ncbi:MAG: PDZ domain-containing protein, partial [Holophaga sp.]|nr:PDZ domain-containing protein [Holophaga sp.]
SPTGARAAFEARGEILTVPAEKGDARNLTQTPGAMERSPAWSPDGRLVAYFSDAGGEYALHLKPQNGKGETTVITLAEKPGFYFNTTWSPDSRKVAYTDAHHGLWFVDVETKQPVKVDHNPFWTRDGGLFQPSWSPDSRYLAYARQLKNHMGAIFAFDTQEKKSHQLTDGMSDVRCPAFDRDGKHLYFAASTNSGASLQPDVHSAGGRSSFSLYVAVLSATDPSPFAPESDEEKGEAKGDDKKGDDKKSEGKGKPDAKPEGKPDDKAEGKPSAKQDAKAKPDAKPIVKLDLEGFAQRVLPLPLPPGNYNGLVTGKPGILFAQEIPPAAPTSLGAPGMPGFNVRRHDLKARKSDLPYTGIQAFELSANGEKVLTRQGGSWSIAAVKPLATGSGPMPPPPPAPGGGLKVEGLDVKVDPKAEWAQMFREAVRIQREFFYDAKHHGLDLNWLEKHYGAWLPAVASRQDLNYLMSEALGEVTVSHLGVGGGNLPQARSVGIGLLGADFELHQGRYRFGKVFNGESWNPGLRAPLTQPGVNVKPGEYLLAVDGRNLSADTSVYAAFENTVGKQVVL